METTTTYADVLGAHDIEVPGHLVADAEIPVLTAGQRQGDVAWWPVDAREVVGEPVPVSNAGVAVVVGENGGNTHRLVGAASWVAARQGDVSSVLLGWMQVAAGEVAYLIHDEEHGANAVGAGTYRVSRKREQRQLIERVQD